MCREVEKLVIAARNKGRAQGRAEGHAEGRKEEKIASIRAIMESLNASAEQAMEFLKVPDAEREELRKLIDALDE